jgi:hypothetical protein
MRNFLLLLAIAAGTLLTITNAKAQYCTTGLYNTSSCDAVSQDYIQSFSTTGGATNITNNATGCTVLPNYTFYSAQTHTGVQGATVNFSITNTPSFTEFYKIWVDWDNNGVFNDTDERMFSPTTGTPAGAIVTGSFVIPISATPGLKRMRVRAVFGTATFDACSNHTYGEVEDYNFQVIALTPCNGVPNGGTATATPNPICLGQNISLNSTGVSLTGGLAYQPVAGFSYRWWCRLRRYRGRNQHLRNYHSKPDLMVPFESDLYQYG